MFVDRLEVKYEFFFELHNVLEFLGYSKVLNFVRPKSACLIRYTCVCVFSVFLRSLLSLYVIFSVSNFKVIPPPKTDDHKNLPGQF